MKRTDIARILNDNIEGRVIPRCNSVAFKPTILVYMHGWLVEGDYYIRPNPWF